MRQVHVVVELSGEELDTLRKGLGWTIDEDPDEFEQSKAHSLTEKLNSLEIAALRDIVQGT